tara:strand:+ start:522 stop:1502 length:981 start_codon:yes stop_codon:yes gene_type:complete
MKIAIIFSICIHSVFYFAMAGFFFPDFKKNNKNLELHSTSISIMDLPSYDAMISNEPILKSSNYEILNSTRILAKELDVNFTNIKPFAMGINIHDNKNLKIFEYNKEDKNPNFNFANPILIKINDSINKNVILKNKIIENSLFEKDIENLRYVLGEELIRELEHKKSSISSLSIAEDNQNIFENLAKIEEDLISIKKVLTLRQIQLNKNLKETIQKKSQYSSKTKKSKKDKNDLKVWSSKILQEINSNINYPVIALQNQISGKVIIQLSITNKGILKKLSLIQSSGFDILDNEVLRAVSNSDHYPSAPLSLSKKQYSFKLPIKFEI